MRLLSTLAWRDPLALIASGLFYIALGLWLWWALRPWLQD